MALSVSWAVEVRDTAELILLLTSALPALRYEGNMSSRETSCLTPLFGDLLLGPAVLRAATGLVEGKGDPFILSFFLI